jgi:GAF domain-containing protein
LAATNGHSRLTNEERRTLLELKSTLLLPLKTKDAMPGVVALGSRLGDLPFSGEDKQLLQSVGASASVALENAQLVERMIAEARRRQEIEAENEQLARELEELRLSPGRTDASRKRHGAAAERWFAGAVQCGG